jgi:hypothetical protein
MAEPTRTAGEEDYSFLLQSQEEREQSGLTALFANQNVTSSSEDDPSDADLDPLGHLEPPLGNSPTPYPRSISHFPVPDLPPSLEQYKAQIESSRRPSPDGDLHHSQSKIQEHVHDQSAQPVDLLRWKATLALRSQAPPVIHDQPFAGGTYKNEQRMTRNQRVLGLKYIQDRYGSPRRPALRPNEPPKYIDNVFGYHDFTTATTSPPPGLETQRGQFIPASNVPRSMLCQFGHERMCYHKVEQPDYDST